MLFFSIGRFTLGTARNATIGAFAVATLYSTSALAIFGGDTLSGEFDGPSMVVTLQKAKPNKYSMTCSAVVIHSNFLLTNGHCVEDLEYREAVKIQDPRTGISMQTNSFTQHARDYQIGFRDDSMLVDIAYDIAVVRLASPLSFEHRVVPLPAIETLTSLELPARAVLIANGFQANKQAGINLSLPIQLSRVKFTTPVKHPVFSFSSGVEGRGPCDQDSGGGLFVRVNGTPVLVALLSSRQIKVTCGDLFNTGFAVPIATHLEWIQGILKKHTKS